MKMKTPIQVQAIACALACAIGCAAGAPQLPGNLKFSEDGVVSVEGMAMSVHHFNGSWEGSDQSHKGVKPVDGVAPRSNGASYEIKGEFTTNGGAKFDFVESVSSEDSKTVKLNYAVSSKEGVESNELSLSLTLPVASYSGRSLMVDGKPVQLPLEFSEAWKPVNVQAKSLSIPLEGGSLVLKGDFPLLIQDDRKYKLDDFSVRVGFTPKSGKITMASLALDVAYVPFQFSCVDLSKAANMGFKDEVADDQKGGWTDQGPENDLRMLKTGPQVLGGVKFDILKPEANDGKSCVVLAGADRPYFPKEASAPASGSFRLLYLLHSAAWYANANGIEAGTLTVSYKDGSSKSFSIGPKELGDWWAPESRPNGSVVWTGENKSSYVGLFLSKFELDPAKELSSISFKSSGVPVWAIVGASLSNDEVRFADSHPVYVVENATWKPLPKWKDIERGTAMDFSILHDAPAGKHGPIVAKDGKLFFEDGTPAKIYGVNLCGSANFLDKEWCEKFADRLAMIGYNAVRFHHCDGGQSNRTATSSTGLHAERMDQMDYLFACLKKRGIYATVDLYISRSLAKGEIPEFPDMAIGRIEFKGLAFVLESVMKNWEDFARNFLTHVNPYTGLAWKDDPAIMGISLINEDTLFGEAKRTPEIKAIYEKLFESWLKEKGLEPDSVQKEVLRNKFLVEVYNKGYARMSSFVRSLGTKALLTDLNHWSSVPMCLMREQFDYVDNHFYWDHPRFIVTDWKLPSSSKNVSAISDCASVPGWAFPSRVFGKPFTITEFDYANPNEFSAEGGALAGAYGALQGWDAIYRFAYAHSSENVKDDNIKGNFFDIGADPVKCLSERMAVMLFLRGDARASEIAYPTLVSNACLDEAATSGNYPKEIWKLGLVGKSGSVVVKDGQPLALPKEAVAATAVEKGLASANCGKQVFVPSKERDSLKEMIETGAVDKSLVDLDKGIFRSSTGELELDSKAQTFKAVTPRSESLIAPQGVSLEGDVMKVENKLSRGVFFAAALDSAPLRSTGRMLILHLTDCQMTKSKFGNEKMTVLEAFGEPPCLIRAGKAKISLKGEFQGCKLYAIEMSGKRIAEIPLSRDGSSVSFEADVFAKGGPVMAYELAKE